MKKKDSISRSTILAAVKNWVKKIQAAAHTVTQKIALLDQKKIKKIMISHCSLLDFRHLTNFSNIMNIA